MDLYCNRSLKSASDAYRICFVMYGRIKGNPSDDILNGHVKVQCFDLFRSCHFSGYRVSLLQSMESIRSEIYYVLGNTTYKHLHANIRDLKLLPSLKIQLQKSLNRFGDIVNSLPTVRIAVSCHKVTLQRKRIINPIE